MAYIYHKVPAKMLGNILYPLNEMKKINQEIYEAAVKKYEGREDLMREMIPWLNCLWNDVLHFSIVHPTVIKEALFKLGHPFRENFFEVPIEAIDPKRTVIYLYRRDDNKLELDEFKPFDPKLIADLAVLSENAKDYYARSVKAGQKVLAFHGVAHVLYRGSLDVSDFKIIKS